VARPETPWEREASRWATRALSSDKADRKPAVVAADAPASAAKPTPAHPGIGPSPPFLEASNSHPLPAALQRRLEAVTGFDLSAVRVVRGPKVEHLATSLRARAFTQHGRIHLGPTASLSDESLLTHEAAHVLQQTLPAPQLARIGLSPADPETVLRQPLGGSPFAERRRARDALMDPLALPRWLMPHGVQRALNWAGAAGLEARLTVAVPEALRPSLVLLRSLQDVWRFAEVQADTYRDRERLWNGVRLLSARTDDPSLVAAARGIAIHLPALLGARWAQLERILTFTLQAAELGVSRWEGGLTSLAPRVAAVLDDLSAEIGDAFDLFPEGSWARNALCTALGCPGSIRTSSDLVRWIDGMRKSADEWIHALSRRARNLVTARFDTRSLAQLAALDAPARDAASALHASAAILSRTKGITDTRESAGLAPLLTRVHEQLARIDRGLSVPARSMTYAFSNIGFDLQLWAAAPVLETFFYGEFVWLGRVGEKIEPWLAQQEPQVLGVAQESLAGLEQWTGRVLETVREAKTLDQTVPDYDRGWFSPIKQLYAGISGAKERIIARLMKTVPLLMELREQATDLWQKAQGHFAHFKARIFTDGAILAPLWELFLNVLSLVVPIGFVRDVAERAGSMLGKILRRPIQFLNNLVKAIGTGLRRFGENIGNHLLNSLLEWLLGEFGLQPPATFGKIVHALMERIGFSRRTLCGRIADYLTRKGHATTAAKVEARIERALQIGATALRWVSFLFQGKFADFWQEIKGHLAKLWQWVVDRAVTFVMDQLVKQLVKWITKFFDPTGLMAALHAIKTLYDLIATVVRYAERMLEIVRQVFQAVREIANNDIDRAALWVEDAARKGLTVVVAFLARALDLGSVVEYFKKGLDEVRKLVVAGMDGLIELTGELWESLIAKAQQAKEWWNSRRKFKDADGATRELSYHVAGSSAVLHVSAPETTGQVVVQKTPQTLEDYLRTFAPASDRERTLYKEIKQRADKIDKIKSDAAGSFGTADGELIYAYFNEIVLLLNELSGRGPTPPATHVEWTVKNIRGDDYGRKMVAHPLSIDPGDNIGSKPVGGDTALWTDVKRHQRGADTAYIQGHLLNHHLHGPGTWKNMIPLSRRTNTRMETLAEGEVKKAVIGQKRVVSYEVTMIFGAHRTKPRTVGEEALPSRVEIRAEELKYSRGKWVPNGVKILPPTTLEHQLRDKTD
jgi:hypothetical protein